MAAGSSGTNPRSLAFCGSAFAQMDNTCNFPADGPQNRNFDHWTVDGVTVTIDHPNGNVIFGDNTFAYSLGGLFIDGGLAPNLDLSFSQGVTIVSYTVANDELDATFSLIQGGISSADNDVSSIGTFPFTNTIDTLLGNVPIRLQSSNHDDFGYAFSSLTVRIISTPMPTAVFAAAGLVALRRRR